jgi:hypothetical protein
MDEEDIVRPPRRHRSDRLCKECADLPHRRSKPICRGCLKPYESEKYVVEHISKNTNWGF